VSSWLSNPETIPVCDVHDGTLRLEACDPKTSICVEDYHDPPCTRWTAPRSSYTPDEIDGPILILLGVFEVDAATVVEHDLAQALKIFLWRSISRPFSVVLGVKLVFALHSGRYPSGQDTLSEVLAESDGLVMRRPAPIGAEIMRQQSDLM
jgi:hypothetical protein